MLPVYDKTQVAEYLVSGYWGLGQGAFYRHDTRVDSEITYALDGLNTDAAILARAALDAWAQVTPLTFRETSGAAQITFQQSQPGAYASFSVSGGYMTSATVNVSENWLASYGNDLTSYGFQTYIHEVGHAIGLGHSGDYNGSATYAADGTGDNHYANDSWQISIMSYFDQNEATEISASKAYVVSTQSADVAAAQLLYGSEAEQTGDTVWGNNATTGSYLDQVAGLSGNISFSILDNGGTDTLDASGGTTAQTLDLRPGNFSDLWGETENVMILAASEIENAIGGSGADTIEGNGLRNLLEGGAGDDTLNGGRMKDTLRGGDGADQLFGGHGLDILEGGAGNDNLRGGVGNDVLRGGDGDDTISGGSGADLGLGGAGNDLVFGNFGSDNLFGYGGNDELRGGAGADSLSGGAGSDRLIGGQGNDTLNGGTGDDRFVFTTWSGNDIITDFEVGFDSLGLAGVNGATGFEQIMQDWVQDVQSGLLLDWGTGSIELTGLSSGDLSAQDFIL